jgi:hypothetical protein
MDPLQPIYVRLKASTVEALKAAQAKSSHRTMASFVDDILRRHLSIKPTQPDRLDQLTSASRDLSRS